MKMRDDNHVLLATVTGVGGTAIALTATDVLSAHATLAVALVLIGCGVLGVGGSLFRSIKRSVTLLGE